MKRSGFGIVEVILALVLAGGPLLVTVQLVRSSTRAAAVAKEHATCRLLLMDFLTVLSGEPVEDLREFSRAETALLGAILDARIQRMPGAHQALYRSEVALSARHLECRLEEGVGDVAGLARLTLASQLSDGTKIEVFRLLRPPPRASVEAGEPIE